MTRKQRKECVGCCHRWMVNIAHGDDEYGCWSWRLYGCKQPTVAKFSGVTAAPCKYFLPF